MVMGMGILPAGELKFIFVIFVTFDLFTLSSLDEREVGHFCDFFNISLKVFFVQLGFA